MAKKKPAAEFNMTQAIREILTENPKLSIHEVAEAVLKKHPSAKINKNSFTVGYYTTRKKLGIGSSRRGKRVGVKRVGIRKSVQAARPKVDLAMMRSAAKFLSEVGSAEAALEAIKQVQAVQVK